MKYCCNGFEEVHKNYDKRGVSIFAKDHFGQPTFIMLFRSININDEKELSEAINEFQKTYYIATERVIVYCPWCGRKLSRFYKKTWNNILGKSLTDRAIELSNNQN